ncbi:ATP-binding protein [Chryseobacterium taklimakanense]|uniref:ATP-binding protein n=1 Tax=Chryseobacterium taklimakanense TaxID=536441 RepID=UPI001EF541CB|nr:ATP-binding protein [Chryseobacterium taklimakanense]MCG7280849.1 ATP-binding protein [Chryseobacterium taklimakanense]
MKLKSVKLKNFRSYKKETTINVDDLTVFVGKNDIGKSTVLEALDIFFNEGKGVIKLDKEDINKGSLAEGDTDIFITAVFTDLPTKIILDATNETTFEDEFLLNDDNCLEITKRYPNAGTAKVFVKAKHPKNPNCSDLLLKKNTDYRRIIEQKNIECESMAINAIMRKAIWKHYSEDLQLGESEIDTSKEDAKNIWEKIQNYLPVFTLFQSDRKNSDGDSEVQDPLKEAVKEILAEDDIKAMFDSISQRVSDRLTEVSTNTLLKLQEMNPEIASSLNPVIPQSASLKWADVYKNVSITGDESIPINKRGSGVKRLILINFFRAEAERRLNSTPQQSIIYAIEEPETSQHTDHQRMLVRAFRGLSEANNTQVMLTTHSSVVVKGLDFSNLRLVCVDENQCKTVRNVEPNQLPYPSLNEINYIAFNDLTEEYHNELYGYIEAEGKLADFKNGKPLLPYVRLLKNGNTRDEPKILTEIIRHQIHHPENTHNVRFDFSQLSQSTDLMRNFISNTLIKKLSSDEI